jgi:Fe-S-cluster containining protein
MRTHFGHDVKRWKITIHHRCVQLDENNRCRIYSTRPQHCREFYCGSPGMLIVEKEI